MILMISISIWRWDWDSLGNVLLRDHDCEVEEPRQINA